MENIEKCELLQGDCLELMKETPDKSIDMILCDLPYGTTACKWDTVIPFEPLWKQYNRIIKDNGAIVLFGKQPFETDLINSNRKHFKYELIWDKCFGTDIYMAKRKPLTSHENIIVFFKEQPTYNPQMVLAKKENMRDRQKNYKKGCEDSIFGKQKQYISQKKEELRYPKSILIHSNQAKELHRKKRLHPTQKPVALLEYLIKTYTNENDVVLDNCMGSGSCGVACINTNRRFIGIELNEGYFNIAKQRIDEAIKGGANG